MKEQIFNDENDDNDLNKSNEKKKKYLIHYSPLIIMIKNLFMMIILI